jgi:methylenetetrahydrofolate reductase (NADPH)
MCPAPSPAAPDAAPAGAAELVASGSLEMGAHRPQDAAAIAALLPSGTPVFVNHLPRHSLEDSLASIAALRGAGLEPVPHVAARRIARRAELEAFLGRAAVGKVLVLGGDEAEARGPFADGAALVRSGLLEAHGVREVGLPGYPEGHPRIPAAELERDLAEKLALAAAHGLACFLVTQFCFAPGRVIEYCAALARRHPALPVYVGLPGPASPAALLRFAQRCGVSASLRALQAQGLNAARLVTHTDPGAQLAPVARYCATHASGCNVVGVHVFSFGGVTAAAGWMNRVLASGA